VATQWWWRCQVCPARDTTTDPNHRPPMDRAAERHTKETGHATQAGMRKT